MRSGKVGGEEIAAEDGKVRLRAWPVTEK